MSDHDKESDDYSKQDGKKVTAAITDAPQEEFLGTESIPSRTENPNTPEEGEGKPPREKGKQQQ